ncbi:hypothetical protein SAMN05720354_10987 [Nitrosospira sp. Nsp1]|nr:hypothetical protein SAMN05720354_10987 [Nitrosospira sp. Nsp1]
MLGDGVPRTRGDSQVLAGAEKRFGKSQCTGRAVKPWIRLQCSNLLYAAPYSLWLATQ